MPQRRADEKQIERHWWILNKIGRRYGVTKRALVQETGVSERTVERDIRVLMRYFPSILEEKDGQQKRYRFKEDYLFPALDLPQQAGKTGVLQFAEFMKPSDSKGVSTGTD